MKTHRGLFMTSVSLVLAAVMLFSAPVQAAASALPGDGIPETAGSAGTLTEENSSSDASADTFADTFGSAAAGGTSLLAITADNAAADAKASVKYGTVNVSIGLNIRTGPGTSYEKIGVLPYGERVEIIGEAKDTKGDLWYKVKCSFGTGYGLNIYFDVTTEGGDGGDYEPDADFEEWLDSQGFPESYKPALRQLHAAYPKWVFRADKTGLSWSQVMDKETKLGLNLVSSYSPDSWKSADKGAYNISTGQYISFDSGGWVQATDQVIGYYMDPRNFLNSTDIFQFMSNKYSSATATLANMQKVTDGTFLDDDFPENVDGVKTYNGALIQCGSKSGVNPMVLASMILQEQGTNGTGNSISGKVPGYEGYYNHFNIGAYAANGNSAVVNGLIYAKKQGWNSRYKSILGGANWYAANYVKNNKYTLYLKKFNVMNGADKVGTGQYMTNVQGAWSEGRHLASGYSAIKNTALEFTIPVYSNMPASPEKLPTNPGDNVNYLKSMSVSAGKLSPAFSPYTYSYTVDLPSDATSVKITAAAAGKNGKVSGTGTISVPATGKKVSVKVTSAGGKTRTYTVNITRNGAPAPEAPGKTSITDTATDFGKIRVYFKEMNVSGQTMHYQIQYQKSGDTSWKTQYATVGYDYATLRNLDYNSKYLVKVRAYYIDGSGDKIYGEWSDTKTVYANRLGNANQVMYAPAITSAEAAENSVALGLKEIAFSSDPVKITYQITYRKTGSENLMHCYSTVPERTVGQLAADTSYDFKVRYYYKSLVDGQLVFSDYTDWKTVKTSEKPAEPAVPGKVSITKSSTDFGRIRVYFSKVNVSGQTMRYQIQYQKSGDTSWKTQYATVGYDYATLRDLTYNGKYLIKVRAYYIDGNGERIYGDWSGTKTIYANRLGNTGQVMYAPSITSAKASSSSVTLGLKKIAFTKDPVKITYQITYRKTGSDYLMHCYTTGTSRTVAKLQKNTSYQFKVRYYYTSLVDDKIVFSNYTGWKTVKTLK